MHETRKYLDLKNKLINLLTKINNNSLNLSTLHFCNKKKYEIIINKIINLQKSIFINKNNVNNILNKINNPDFQKLLKENKNIIFVKSDEKLVAILGKNIPKSLLSIDDYLHIKPIDYNNKQSLLLNNNLLFIKQLPVVLLNNKTINIFLDIKIHTYRSYKPIPSILILIKNEKVFVFDFNKSDSFNKIIIYLKNEKISCYQKNKDFLIKYFMFSIENISVVKDDFLNILIPKSLKFIDWRIRPINLIKEYLLYNLNPINENLNTNIYSNYIYKENSLFFKLKVLRETLAIENNESPEFILNETQLNLIYNNRNKLFNRKDIDKLLKIQSPLFRSHVMDFLLLLNNKERVYNKINGKKQKFLIS